MATAQTIIALVENESGTLNRLMSLFRRKTLSIDSLAVGDCEQKGFSRMSLVLHAEDEAVNQCVVQMDKLLDVVEVQHVPDDMAVQRELSLVSVHVTADRRREVLEIGTIMKCEVAHLGHENIILQCAADTKHLEHLFNLLEPYGITQIVRSGVVAIRKEI
jgi:acetolactate synthase I/III small subunit